MSKSVSLLRISFRSKEMKTVISMIVIGIFCLSIFCTLLPKAKAQKSTLDWWPMFQHDLSHSGYSTSKAPLTNQTLWNFTTGGAVESSPVVVDGIVYVGSDDGNVYALNAYSGALVWSYNTWGPVQSSPTVLDGVVYVGGFHSHAVFALNASSGALLWNSPIASSSPHIISSTAVANGLVYVDEYNMDESGGQLYALNASTGALVWNYQPSAWLSSSPAVSGGAVYIGTSIGLVVALDAFSGNTLWSYIIRSDGSNSSSGGAYPVSCSLSLANGLVYVGTPAEMVQALDASTGKFVWSGAVVGGVDSSCSAVANGTLYVTTTYGGSSPANLHYGGITALNAATGTKLWNTTIGSIMESSPAVADGVVFVGSDDTNAYPLNAIDGHNVYALNAATGAFIWNYTTGGAVYSSPAVANGVVYVGSNDGKVYAFGSPQKTTPSSPSLSPAATPPNTEPEPLTTALVAAAVVSVAVVAAGLLVYFKKRKHAKINKHNEIDRSSALYSKRALVFNWIVHPFEKGIWIFLKLDCRFFVERV
jgi:glucose dehydrogenase